MKFLSTCKQSLAVYLELIAKLNGERGEKILDSIRLMHFRPTDPILSLSLSRILPFISIKMAMKVTFSSAPKILGLTQLQGFTNL